ncbi:DUF2187 family protein [Edaphobacillus lindanitolerans]|uniref:DUF2187 domain-containing protein n=1 Tax=Edaphobacillus lindanitolerans TaxID=550447 RepID=A0A1U7PIT0_9BACI|nr:DUF2187 family protein [Edaphobacillus lindanitolerans]SIT75599.1 hypothetical protein SAMN05428946_1178 [Edaphobacillus lindanitolerans]
MRVAFPAKQKEPSAFVAARSTGELISFVRNNHEVFGTIVKILENSVIVKLSKADARRIGAASEMTVVSHKHYTVTE